MHLAFCGRRCAGNEFFRSRPRASHSLAQAALGAIGVAPTLSGGREYAARSMELLRPYPAELMVATAEPVAKPVPDLDVGFDLLN